MNNRSIVLTGGTGHLGSKLTKILLEKNYKVKLLIRKRSYLANYLEDLGAELHLCNLNNQKSYEKVLKQCDAAFHLASDNTMEIRNRNKTIKNTFGITKVFISSCIKNNIKKIVYTSSVVVLGRSKNKNNLVNLNDKEENLDIPYVEGKILSENWIRNLVLEELDIRIVYPSWVIGNGSLKETPPNAFLKKLAKSKSRFSINGGISVASIDDVAYGHYLAFLNGSKNGRYILSGHNMEFKDISKEISKRFHNKNKIFILPNNLIKLSSILLGKFSPIDYVYAKAIVGTYSWYDHSKAHKEIGYNIKSIKETFDDIEKYIKQKELNLDIFNLKKSADKKFTKGKTLFITGFPGWLANRAIEKIIDSIENQKNFAFNKIILLVQEKFIDYIPKLPNYFEVRKGDLSDLESLRNSLDNVSCVWHLAGTIYPKRANLHYKINYNGTKNLTIACIEKNVKRFLYMSTDSVCGTINKKDSFFTENQRYSPYKDYGKSKYYAEKLLFTLNKKGLLYVTVFRGFWFFGPNMPERNKNFLKSFTWPFQIVFGNGENYRSITHLDDVIQAFISSSEIPKTFGKWYWITSLKKALTVNQIYKEIGDALGIKVRLINIPNIICDFLFLADIFYTKLFRKINATLLAAGKFHKNIAVKQEFLKNTKKDFKWSPKTSLSQIKEEIKNEIRNTR